MRDDSNWILENIRTRSSIRDYQNEIVGAAVLEKVLRAGMAAPSAGNRQPWEIIVVNDQHLLQQLGEQLPYASMVAKAPMAIVVCGNLGLTFIGDESEYWVQDCSALTENMLLAAHALGLGAVWTGVYPIPDRMKIVSDILSLPTHILPLNVIPMGYPKGLISIKDKWDKKRVQFNSWNK